MSKQFDEHIQPGDEVIYNEDLGCRVNLSQLKRVAKKSDYVKADYCSKELCLLLRKKGIEASHTMRFEEGGSWYNRYTLDVACKWLREVHKIGVFPSTYCFTRGDEKFYRYGTAIINLLTHELMVDDYMPKDTYEEAVATAIEYCLNNLIKA